MSYFNSYAKEFAGIFQTTSSRVEQLRSLTDDNERQILLKDISSELLQMRELVEQMDVSADTNEESAKCTELKQSLKTIEVRVVKATSNLNDATARKELFGGKNDIELMASKGHQERFRDTTRKLKDGDQYIDSAIMTVQDTIGIASGVMTDLDAQRDTIIRSRTRIGRIQDGITNAFRKTREIGRRLSLERIIIGVIFLILVATLILILYFKFAPKSSPDPNPNPTPTPPNDENKDSV